MALLDYVMNNPTVNSLLDYAMREPLNALAAVIAVLFIVLFVIHFFACDPDDDSVVHTDYGDIPKDVYEECEAANREKEAAKNKEEEEDLRCGAEYYGLCDIKSEDECDARWQEGKCIYHTDEDVIDKIDRLEKVEQEDLKKNDACFDCDAQNAKQCLTKQEEGTCDYHVLGKSVCNVNKPAGHEITIQRFKNLLEKYANLEIGIDDNVEAVLARSFLYRRVFDCYIGNDTCSIDLLNEANSYYNISNSHIDKDTFSIVATIIFANDEYILIDNKNITIDKNGDFSFKIRCGWDEHCEDIYDTVSGNMDFNTGVLTISTSRFHEENKKVYSIIVLAAVVDHDFSYEDFMGWRTSKTEAIIKNIDKRVENARKDFEKKAEMCRINAYMLDYIEKLREEAENNTEYSENGSQEKKQAKEPDHNVDLVVKENEGRLELTEEQLKILADKYNDAEFLDDNESNDSVLKASSNRHMYEYVLENNPTKINLIDEISPYYDKELTYIDKDNFSIKCAVILVNGKEKFVDVDCYIGDDGNFAFDVKCGYDDCGYNIMDYVYGNMNFKTGDFSASSSRCMIKDKKVHSIVIFGTIVERDLSYEEFMSGKIRKPKDPDKVAEAIENVKNALRRKLDNSEPTDQEPKDQNTKEPEENHKLYWLKDPIDPTMAGVPIEDHENEDECNCKYEYPLGENVTYVNLLKVVNPDYTPAIAHVNSSDFKIESVVILDDGVQEEVEVDCEIDYAGNFCFDVACGMGTYEMIYDTIRGNINYTTGIFTATSDNYANPDHKVCSLIISGTVSTFEEIPIEEAMKKIKNLSTPKEDPKVIKPVGEIRLSQREIDELVAKMRKPKETEN